MGGREESSMTERSDGIRGLTRRSFLALGAAGAAAWVLPGPRAARALSFELPEAARDALAASPLVYVSPLKKDGSESTCHGEVWFVQDGKDVVLVTAVDRWKARSVRAGLGRARLWVGDFGVWTRADGKYKSAPTFLATVSLDAAAAARERALEAFGKKYPDEWDKWGPRFRDGLADGSRVLLRYVPSEP
jgi:hypothetical protein